MLPLHWRTEIFQHRVIRYLILIVVFSGLVSCTDRKGREESANAPELTAIDSTALHQLILNESDNLRLINIWATWCAPCLEEFPVFVELADQYSDKPFEFIAVSADEMKDREKVLRFLTKQNPLVDSYIFAGEEVYQLIYNESIGWNGSLPFTILVEPGGRVAYRVNEAIDPVDFTRMLAAHPMINKK